MTYNGVMAREAMIDVVGDACLHESGDAFVRDLRGFLEARGVAAEDVEALVASPPRLAVYRRLIRNNLTGVTFKMLARTRNRLNAQGTGEGGLGLFDGSFAAFLHERGPRTHYLRDVPHEFLAWAEARWRADQTFPRWAVDLARHELSEYELAAAPNLATGSAGEAHEGAATGSLGEVTLDRPLVFQPAVRLAFYGHAVHELPEGEDDRSEPRPEPTALLVYRDGNHRVRFLALTPLAAAILDRLLAGQSLGTAIPAACADQGRAADDAVLASTAALLADLGERGVLLGARV